MKNNLDVQNNKETVTISAISMVNWIAECCEYKSSRKVSCEAFECAHKTRVSLTYLYQCGGFKTAGFESFVDIVQNISWLLREKGVNPELWICGCNGFLEARICGPDRPLGIVCVCGSVF